MLGRRQIKKRTRFLESGAKMSSVILGRPSITECPSLPVRMPRMF